MITIIDILLLIGYTSIGFGIFIFQAAAVELQEGNGKSAFILANDLQLKL